MRKRGWARASGCERLWIKLTGWLLRCSWAGDGPLVGSASNGQLFIFDRHQRQVTHTIQLRSLGTPLAGVPEAHGVVHLTAACTRNTPFLLHAAKQLRGVSRSLCCSQPTAMCTA